MHVSKKQILNLRKLRKLKRNSKFCNWRLYRGGRADSNKNTEPSGFKTLGDRFGDFLKCSKYSDLFLSRTKKKNTEKNS